MKREEENIAKLLKSFLPSAERTELAGERVRQRLQRQHASLEESKETVTTVSDRRSRRWPKFAIVACAAALMIVVFMRMPSRLLEPPMSAQAVVESADGGLFRVSGGQALHAGNRIEAGDAVRTDRGIGTVIALTDGSRIEMRPQSALALQQANDGVRIHLDNGGIIVAAAKQRSGHLYVQTKYVTVSVVGTVFLVNTEDAGSRVAVIQGEVYVQQGPSAKKLLPGEQLATNPLMESHPVSEQLSWSREAETYLETLRQSAPSQSDQSAPKKLEFEAASLRELEQGAFPGGFVGCRGVDGLWSYDRDVAGFGGPPDSPIVPQGRCIGSSGMKRLIAAAYGVPIDRVSGGENGVWSYRLDAKAENTETATTVQLREMLQSLMIDRFKLKAHRYTEEKPGHLLVVAKGGPKFKETSGDEELPRPRVVGPFGQGSLPYLIAGKFRMKNFAQYLSAASVANDGHPVVDRTELFGIYDISLVLHQKPPAGVRGGGAVASEMWDPPIGDALEDQLGLKLEPASKVPLEYLSIDHIEKAAENE